jgi:hypothetical protein
MTALRARALSGEPTFWDVECTRAREEYLTAMRQLQDRLPSMTAAQAARALKLADKARQQCFLATMPDAVMRLISVVAEVACVHRGAEERSSFPLADSVIFAEEGELLNVTFWKWRQSGKRLSREEVANLGPVIKWYADGRQYRIDIVDDDFIELLYPPLAREYRQALQRGYWP